MCTEDELRKIEDEINEQLDSEDFISIYDVYKKLGIPTPEECYGEDKDIAEIVYAEVLYEWRNTGWRKDIPGMVRREKVYHIVETNEYEYFDI